MITHSHINKDIYIIMIVYHLFYCRFDYFCNVQQS